MITASARIARDLPVIDPDAKWFGAGTGEAACTHYDSGVYQTVWFGINFHSGVVNQADRDQLMTNVLTYFGY